VKRSTATALLGLVALAFSLDGFGPAADRERSARTALQAFNGYIGSWSADGKAEKNKEAWTENVEWGWRFKGDECWLTFKTKGGKHIRSGELRWLPDKDLFQFAAIDTKDEKLVFEGKIEKESLTLHRVDPKTKEQQRLVMFNTGDGVLFNYRFSHAPEGGKNFIKDYEVRAMSESDASVFRKRAVCIVSGGLGRMTLTYKGNTYYVCCSGCRDAFNEQPEKYIRAWDAKQKK